MTTSTPATVPATAWCHRCQATTPTALLDLRCGHRANVCAHCRAMRKGRPYVSKRATLDGLIPTPVRAAGESHHHVVALGR